MFFEKVHRLFLKTEREPNALFLKTGRERKRIKHLFS